jgi:hypothetical protein
MKNTGAKLNFGYAELLVCCVFSTSVFSLLALQADCFVPLAAFWAGVVVTALFAIWQRKRLTLAVRRKEAAACVLLALAALLFRVPPYRYEIGGQDPGIYASLSRHFEETGSRHFVDSTRERIKEDPELTAYYEKYSRRISEISGTRFGPSVEAAGTSRFVIEFSHLHSLWLSVFSSLLGPAQRSWSSVFFGLLSIFALVCLCRELTGDAKSSCMLGLFLAIHPLHAYLSKLPVPEVQSLAFAAFGLYFLARFENLAQTGLRPYSWLWFSAASFCLYFLTQINLVLAFSTVLSLAVLLVCRILINREALSALGKRFLSLQPLAFKGMFFVALGQIAYALYLQPLDVFQNSSFVYLSYVFPLLLPVLAVYMDREEFQGRAIQVLCFILNVLACSHLLLNRNVAYQYYCSRYLLGDFVPLSLVLGVYCLDREIQLKAFVRWLSPLVVVLTVACWVYYSGHQFKGREAWGSYQALDQVEQAVPDGAVVLLVKDGLVPDQEIGLGLSVYRGMNVVVVNSLEDVPWLAKRLRGFYKELFLLSPVDTDLSGSMFVKRIDYRQGTFGYWRNTRQFDYRSRFIPTEFYFLNQDLFLYELLFS